MQAVLYVALKEYLARHTTGAGAEPTIAYSDSLLHLLSAVGVALQRIASLLDNAAARGGRAAKHGTENLADAVTAGLRSALKLTILMLPTSLYRRVLPASDP